VVPFERIVSRITFVMLLLISVNFDGLLATPQWSAFERARVGADPSGVQDLRAVSFVLLTAMICTVFGLFAWAAIRAGGTGGGVRVALTGLMPSLVPIAFGYLLAHNAAYLLVNSQLMLPLIGNPVGTESWPIRLPCPFNDSHEPNRTILPSAFYWYLGAVAIVAVHVVAVVLAHRHLAGTARDERRGRRSEYPWLVAMVGYTAFNLYLIAQPLVQEKQPAEKPGAAVARASAVAVAPASSR